jgi:hypothetical protein
MTTRPLLLGLLLSATALAEEIPRAIQITEPPAPLKLDGQDRVISRTKQFRVTGGEPQDRATISQLAEEAKDELLRLTEERDAWKVPVTIELHGKSGDPMPPRTVAMKILVSEVGYDLRLDVHLSRGIEHERFKFATTSALIYERTLRDHPPNASDTPYHVPPWLVDGLREATAWRLDQSDRRLYEALFKTGGLFKIDDVFAINDAGFEEMDAAMRAAFRVSSGALVMALLQQPQGKDGFRSFLTEVASYEGEMPSLLRKHFPELNLSETSLDKWWRLQMADIGARNLATDILTIARTETALSDALRLNFRTPEGITEQKDLTAWPELAALPEPERVKAVQPAQDALVRLSYRCFPSYRPILAEYQIVLGSIAKNKTMDLPGQLTALAGRRDTMNAKARRAGDYLDWFEITRARETSGAFDDYMRLKDRLKANPRRRNDDLSKYLDRMDAIFTRKGDPAAPAGSPLALPGIPELPQP